MIWYSKNYSAIYLLNFRKFFFWYYSITVSFAGPYEYVELGNELNILFHIRKIFWAIDM